MTSDRTARRGPASAGTVAAVRFAEIRRLPRRYAVKCPLR